MVSLFSLAYIKTVFPCWNIFLVDFILSLIVMTALFLLLYSDVNFCSFFLFFWEKSKDLFFKVPFATNIISLSFCEPQASGSCMRAQPYFGGFVTLSSRPLCFGVTESIWELQHP